ncbi:MAG: hypothetical protein P4L22_06910 [Candidatus Babeliales bacterium]|nr:hypothetical protein [Candidatus Babeliales bacterium]
MDKDGRQQVAILESEMVKLSKDIYSLGGKKASGTFHGDDQDLFKAKLPLEENMGELNYIWGSKDITKVGEAIIYSKTMQNEEPEEFTTRDYPSDHQALIVKAKIYNKSVSKL